MGRVLTLAAAGIVLLAHLAGSGPVMAASGGDEARAELKDTTEKVLAALRNEGPELKDRPERLYAIIDDLILPHFDFKRMSAWVLGRHWPAASDAQKSRFLKAFQGLLVRTYSRALIDYRDQRIEFLTSRERSAEDVTVRAAIDQGAGPSIPVSYEVSLVDGVWKVHDVSVNGVSLVINYRASFNQEIQRNGLDALILRLEAHNSKSSS